MQEALVSDVEGTEASEAKVGSACTQFQSNLWRKSGANKPPEQSPCQALAKVRDLFSDYEKVASEEAME